MTLRRQLSAGFTLVEIIMVIAIIGIIGGMVAVFVTAPIQGYVDSVRRAELTDAADVALRRLTRDIRLALPNSLRVMTVGDINYIEFIMTSSGGRYRDPTDGSTAGNFLSFTDPFNVTFDVLGPLPNMAIGDSIVVYNLGAGYAPADAYAGGNRAAISNIAGNVVTLANNPFANQSPPLPSPNARFQVIPAGTNAISYACPTAVAGNLDRYANYGFNAAQAIPANAPSVLASGVTCTINYIAASTGRNGLLYIELTITDATSGENVTLFQQIHVDNTP